jgi:hypothetical protein
MTKPKSVLENASKINKTLEYSIRKNRRREISNIRNEKGVITKDCTHS